jgi:hypothetical protein
MKTTAMKTNGANDNREESTYSPLARTEERKRGTVEVIAYGVIALSALVAIWEFGQELFRYQS